MNHFIMNGLAILWGFAGGLIISTAIASFIAIIGIVPRIMIKTQTKKYYLAVETATTLGIFTGSMLSIWQPYVPLPKVIIIIISFSVGIFIGCLAVSIAETLDVIPIMSRRIHLKRGIYLFIISFAIGKMIGAFYYWLYPGFTKLSS